MKKLFAITFLALLVISMIGVVSATTTIAGKIYTADYSDTVADATVEVTCNGNLIEATSQSDGSYGVSYDEIDVGSGSCDVGDSLSVYAFKEGIGENTKTGEINDKAQFESLDVNLGIVNIPLVPEFGFFIGALTIMSAVGVFFLVRRE